MFNTFSIVKLVRCAIKGEKKREKTTRSIPITLKKNALFCFYKDNVINRALKVNEWMLMTVIVQAGNRALDKRC